MDMDEETALNDNAQASGSTSSSSRSATGEPKPSKNALKRAAKLAQYQAVKPQRRAAEKARRRERATYLAEGYAAGTLNPDERKLVDSRRERQREVKASKRHPRNEEWGGGVVIDLGFDELMLEQEIKSMTSQIGYVYSVNRIAPLPFSNVLFTSFSEEASPRLWETMSKVGWDRWTRCSWTGEGVGEVAKHLREGQSPAASPGTEAKDARGDKPGMPALPLSWKGKGKSLVYLSADSDEEITMLSEDEIYIIGGIVDRNRYKSLCQEKAVKLGIRTARLPIGSFLANLPTRKVLTVNQVFAILVEFNARQSWAEAFEAVIPQRKYQIGRKGRRAKGGTDGGVQRREEDDHTLGGASGEEPLEEDEEAYPRESGDGKAAESLLAEEMQ